MEPDPILPDDPRLTAYALEEMTPAEKAGFEKLLEQQPAARESVEDIRATTALLTAALESEPVPSVAPIAAKRDPYHKIIRFPYWQISGLAAACFAVFFIYWQRNEILNGPRQYIEVPLTAPADARDEARTKTTSAGVTVNLPVAGMAPAAVDAKKQREQDSVAANGGTLNMAEPAPAAPSLLQETVVLAPFAVGAKQDAGFATRSSLARSQDGSFASKDIATGGAAVAPGLAGNIIGAVNGKAEQHYGFTAAPGAIGDGKANTETYAFRQDNAYQRVADQPLSTFSADVDTASYTNVRRFLTEGQRPPADAVRIEELLNYFPYHYAGPSAMDGQASSPANDHVARVSAFALAKTEGKSAPAASVAAAPFAAHLEVASAPWAPTHRLVRVGLKGREVSDAARPAANLVFLLDVSGSMNEPNRLPLVKQSLHLLVEKLRPQDRVAIVVYAGASGLALPSTSAAHKAEITDAIDRLQAEGSTNGAAGIQLAYDIAKANFITGGVNRVILATDGDFNVGVTSQGELVRLIGEKAKSGVFLTVLGFGMDNYKDATLEQLADKGNGNYAYIDSLAEAKKTLVEQAGGTLVTIAKDVKLQVEFNPALVQAYRLIGYEKRLLAKEDFNNDQVDAGEIGAGHTVTALYEIVPVGAAMPGDSPAVDALKYQVTEKREAGSENARSGELLTVKIRYKDPVGDVSSKLQFPLRDTGAGFEEASQDFKFAAAVAAFGMALRDSPYKGTTTLANVVAWARSGVADDAGGYRNEFISLVERAQKLAP